MLFTSALLALVASALAAPAPETFGLTRRAEGIPECSLPDPGTNCAGVKRKDVIIQYGKNFTQDQKDLFLNAATAAGGQIHDGAKSWGFMAYVDEATLKLIKAHGDTCGLKITENGCMGIPWCGEAPC